MRLKRRTRDALVMAGLMVGMAHSGNAQQTDTAQQAAANGAIFGDWRLSCQAVAVNRTACAIVQQQTVTQTDAFVAAVRLQQVQDDSVMRILMTAITPTDMQLSLRAAYKIGQNGETLPMEWRTCNAQTCTATRLLEPAEVEALQRGTAAMILAYQPVGKAEPVGVSISLSGITAGLAALQG